MFERQASNMHPTVKTSAAVKSMLMIGVLSFFADFTYERHCVLQRTVANGCRLH
jgi:hypothetical protein